MKIKITAFVLMLLISLSAHVVFAQQEAVFENVDINYDRKTGTVNVSGCLKENIAEKTARMIVLKPDTDVDKLIEGSINFLTCGVHASETEVSDGTFAFDEFVINESYPAGDYILRIAASNKVYTAKISVASVKQAVELADKAVDSLVLNEYINKYNGEIYKLNIGAESLYDSFEDEDKQYILQKLCGEEIKDTDDFNRKFDMHTALRKMYVGPWGSLESVICDYYDVLDVDISDFEDLESDLRDEVCKEICAAIYEDAESFEKAFKAAVSSADSNDDNEASSGPSRGGSGGGMTYYQDVKETQKKEEPRQEETEIFRDLEGYLWAKESIELLYSKAIVNGKGKNEFDPGAYVTRSEAVKMIILAMGEKDFNVACNFEDVDKDNWAYPYIAIATNKNIVYGYGDSVFGASDCITRQDLAVIVSRAINTYGHTVADSENKKPEFKDENEISPYAVDAVNKLKNAGIINGSERLFKPKSYATRAEVAVIIANVIK